MNQFAQKMADWHNSEHNAKWMEGVKQLHAKDPEAFKSRGKKKAPHHFEGLKLLDQPHKAEPAVDVSALPPELAAKFGNKEQPAPAAEAPAQSAAPQAEVKPAAPASLAPEHIANLPPALQAKFGGKK
jgi:hypothetical protein